MVFPGVLGALLHPPPGEYGPGEGLWKEQRGALFMVGWPAGGSTPPVPEAAQGDNTP